MSEPYNYARLFWEDWSPEKGWHRRMRTVARETLQPELPYDQGARRCVCCKQKLETYMMTKFLNTTSAAYLVVCLDCHQFSNIDSKSPYRWNLILKEFGLGADMTGVRSIRSTTEILSSFKSSQIERIQQKQKKRGIVCNFSTDIGCTLSELERYLERRFQPRMTWMNHALDGWHIDHIRPLSAVNLRDAADIESALHYTNLRPLWRKNNVSRVRRTYGRWDTGNLC